MSTHLRKEHEEDKLGILDVRVFVCGQSGREEAVLGERSHKGESQMDLEIQLAPFPLWPERSMFYLAKM